MPDDPRADVVDGKVDCSFEHSPDGCTLAMATPIPSGIQPGLPKKDDSSKKEVAPVGAGADADDSSKPKPSDYTGGLG